MWFSLVTEARKGGVVDRFFGIDGTMFGLLHFCCKLATLLGNQGKFYHLDSERVCAATEKVPPYIHPYHVYSGYGGELGENRLQEFVGEQQNEGRHIFCRCSLLLVYQFWRKCFVRT